MAIDNRGYFSHELMKMHHDLGINSVMRGSLDTFSKTMKTVSNLQETDWRATLKLQLSDKESELHNNCLHENLNLFKIG